MFMIENCVSESRISIIIPIYNTEKYLRRLLNSISEQTYTNYEVLLINDGSTDASEVICNEWRKKDSRFLYFYQSNQGVSAARNLGLEKMTGNYVVFLDSDDVIDRNYLEELLIGCKDVDICVCDVVVESNQETKKIFSCQEKFLNREEALNKLFEREEINSGPCAKIYRKEVVGNIRYKQMKTYEDILFVMDVFDNARCIATTNQTKYHYIENVSGAMSSMLKNPSRDIIVATDIIMHFLQKNPNLSDKSLYITVSHLLQYAFEVLKKSCYRDDIFLHETRKLYKKYLLKILRCSVIPLKEKLLFFMFTKRVVYSNGKLHFIKD